MGSLLAQAISQTPKGQNPLQDPALFPFVDNNPEPLRAITLPLQQNLYQPQQQQPQMLPQNIPLQAGMPPQAPAPQGKKQSISDRLQALSSIPTPQTQAPPPIQAPTPTPSIPNVVQNIPTQSFNLPLSNPQFRPTAPNILPASIA